MTEQRCHTVMEPQRFRKRPVVIEAMRFTQKTAQAVIEWSGAMGFPASEPFFDPDEKPQNGFLVIETLEGAMRVELGDWVIRGIKGEFYPCKPDIFEATYERA